MTEYIVNAAVVRASSCVFNAARTLKRLAELTREATRYAEFDRRVCARGRDDVDVVGHYARPDILSLSVDTRAVLSVAFEGVPSPDAMWQGASASSLQRTEGRTCSD